MNYSILEPYGTMYYVKDMKKAVTFWREHLGLSPSLETPDWTEFSLGSSSLCLHLLSEADRQVQPNGILIIRTKGLRNLIAKLKHEHVRIAQDVKEVHPGAFAADIFDPDGNEISFYEKID